MRAELGEILLEGFGCYLDDVSGQSHADLALLILPLVDAPAPSLWFRDLGRI